MVSKAPPAHVPRDRTTCFRVLMQLSWSPPHWGPRCPVHETTCVHNLGKNHGRLLQTPLDYAQRPTAERTNDLMKSMVGAPLSLELKRSLLKGQGNAHVIYAHSTPCSSNSELC